MKKRWHILYRHELSHISQFQNLNLKIVFSTLPLFIHFLVHFLGDSCALSLFFLELWKRCKYRKCWKIKVSIKVCDVPAGINQDDEFVPQGSVAYRQANHPEWTLIFPNSPIEIQISNVIFFYLEKLDVKVKGENSMWTHSKSKATDSLWIRGSLCEVKTRWRDGVLWQQTVRVEPTHVWYGRRGPPSFRSQEGATSAS